MRVAVIGVGSMGGAVVSGILRGGTPAADVVGSVRSPEHAARVREEFGIDVLPAADAARGADVVVLAVKPYAILDVAREVAPGLADDAVVVSVAAGVPADAITEAVGGRPVVRAMPNTPSRVGEGVVGLAAGPTAAAHLERTADLLAPLGLVRTVTEPQLDAVVGVAGSGVAYVFLLAEALVDAGVLLGLPRADAAAMAAQTIAGAGALLAEDGADATALRAAVTSPGGTTAAALHVLEDRGLRAAVQAAAVRAAERSAEMAARAGA